MKRTTKKSLFMSPILLCAISTFPIYCYGYGAIESTFAKYETHQDGGSCNDSVSVIPFAGEKVKEFCHHRSLHVEHRNSLYKHDEHEDYYRAYPVK